MSVLLVSVAMALRFGGSDASSGSVRERVAAAGLSQAEFEQHVHARGRDAAALAALVGT